MYWEHEVKEARVDTWKETTSSNYCKRGVTTADTINCQQTSISDDVGKGYKEQHDLMVVHCPDEANDGDEQQEDAHCNDPSNDVDA